MLSNKVCGLLAVFLLSITIPSVARAQKPMGEVMCKCPGVSKPLGNAANCEEACYGRRSSPGGASSDTRAREEARAREAEARAREEAEAAERVRIAEEKRKKDKEESDAKFIRDRDEAASTLKGSTGTTTQDAFGLKGSTNYGLKNAVTEPGLKGSTTFSLDPLPAIPEVPVTLPDSVREPLIAKRQPLAQRKLAMIEEGKALNQSCASVEKGSGQHQSCLTKRTQFNSDVQVLSVQMRKLADAIDAAVGTHIIKSMNVLAKRLGWSADEQARLDKALNTLASDGDSATSAQIIHAWNDVLARDQNGSIAREASEGAGPGFPGAGEQTRHQDCAVFALANAAGLPYGVAATRAAELIRQGEWRDAAERANPQKVIEQKGLSGGEVVMLAEAFGRVEVVPSSNFAKILMEGRPLMVNVVPEDGNVNGGHEVVLTKAFQHGGETWYEMMDSNQGSQRRLYLSAKELNTMLQENGVAFRPEPGTTPKLLR